MGASIQRRCRESAYRLPITQSSYVHPIFKLKIFQESIFKLWEAAKWANWDITKLKKLQKLDFSILNQEVLFLLLN